MEAHFTDERGRPYAPDPAGRYPYRAFDRNNWTKWVCGGPGEEPTTDAAGAQEAYRRHWAQDQRPHVPDSLPPGAQQWEYKVLSATFGNRLEEDLNAEGRFGWEVVSISAANGTLTLTGNKLFALLKRPRIDRPPPPPPTSMLAISESRV